jgi:hypothetical protein
VPSSCTHSSDSVVLGTRAKICAHREDNDKAITALDRKAALKIIDVDADGKMALIEYLLWKYKKTVGAVANASQGMQRT